jgi:hypothetical protein
MFKKEMGRLLLALAGLLFFSSYCNAQVSTNPNTGQSGDILVLGNGWTGTISQCTHNVNCWAGSTDTGDIHHGYDSSQGNGNTYYWSGTQQTLTNTIAINTALAAAGIQVDGFDYEWVYKNGNANWFSGQPGGGGVDPLEIVVNVYDSNGNLFKSYKYDYGQNFASWTTATGTETFGTNYLSPTYFGNVEVQVTAQDIANQAGYWGPEFRADQSRLYVNYSVNPCHTNSLHDPACPGYANALFQQQCTANPLFDASCPGYANAYFTQQCNISQLYDQACPGYAAAYLKQQCFIDPLYDSSCPGYSTAYQNQQCTNDPTSDPACPDYYIAMCKADALFDMGCIGYDIAYFDQQCSLDSQYDQTCPGYVDLSGNDGDIAILDPIVDDVITVEPELDFYEPEIPVYQPTYTEEVVEVEPEAIEIDEYQQVLEDDIEREIAELENEGDAMNMEDDIEQEIAQLEDSTSSENDFDDPTNTGGKEVMEDDIEKEIAELEQESDTNEGDSESTLEDGVQVADSDARPDNMDNSVKSSKRKDVPSPDVSKRQKIKWLIAQKAIEATKELENAVTLEQQMNIQRRLLALISFVPDFSDYGEKENVNQVNFYPPKPTVDHAYARWFLNDPNFGAMENLQYPNLR